ncbi:beta/gamma crystallin-related protein [Uliginosibacterium sediminicola]|uniref:Beta/gamma crystallin-related protein n=1 Tax=Uliginosibacterium sediminicola TaxID=2024550 RepID=A0ABU9Z185_9RHOO
MHIKSTLGIAALLVSAQAMAQITFYEGSDFRGRAFTTSKSLSNFQRGGFNDRASSVEVSRGRWQVCSDVGFKGHCVILRQGSYDSLQGMGMQRRISSVRPASAAQGRSGKTPEPLAQADYAYRRRPDERTYTIAVSSVRAVVGPPTQHCWVEREQVTRPRAEANVGGAIVGAILGGVLGHQVGGYRLTRRSGRRSRQSRDPPLRTNAQRPARLLGRQLSLPRSGTSRANECATGTDPGG